MTEVNKYSPYDSEEDLRNAMCIHEAGHIVAYYYAFNTIDPFEWAVVNLEEYINNKSITSVETKFQKYIGCEKYIEEKHNFSIDKYTYLMKIICYDLGGGACEKHFEKLRELPSWSMGKDSKILTNDLFWYDFNLQIIDFDNFKKRRNLMNENAKAYLDYLFSIGSVQRQAKQIADILYEKSKSQGDKRIYLKDIKNIFESTNINNQ